MSKSIRIAGADDKATNQDGNNYAPAVQVSAQRCFAYKLVVSVPPAVGAPRYVWLFDTAAGAAGSKGPEAVLAVGDGTTATLDFGAGGKLFKAGLYVAVATDAPADANTPRTEAANNEALVAVDYRNL